MLESRLPSWNWLAFANIYIYMYYISNVVRTEKRRGGWRKKDEREGKREGKNKKIKKKGTSDLFVARRSVERKWRWIYGQATSD